MMVEPVDIASMVYQCCQENIGSQRSDRCNGVVNRVPDAFREDRLGVVRVDSESDGWKY